MTDRIDGIIDRVSDAEEYEKASWLLGNGVLTNFAVSVIDDTIKANVDFQGKAGLPARVKRYSIGYCCKWCNELIGTYRYPDVPDEVWHRHQNCNCVIEYTPSGGGRTDYLAGEDDGKGGTTKKWYQVSEEELEKRKKNGIVTEDVVKAKERLKDLGFTLVSNSLDDVAPETLVATVNKLEELENKHHAIGAFNIKEIIYNPNLDAMGRTTWTSADDRLRIELGSTFNNDNAVIETVKNGSRNRNYMPFDMTDETARQYTITHEYGHVLADAKYSKYNGGKDSEKYFSDVVSDIVNIAKTQNADFTLIENLSRVSTDNQADFIAECFANANCGAPNDLGRAMDVWVRRNE